MSQDNPWNNKRPGSGRITPSGFSDAGHSNSQTQGKFAALGGFLLRWMMRGIIIGANLALVAGAFYFVVWWVAHDRCYSSVDDVPPRNIGVVLGCVKKVGHYDNAFFNTRVAAAAKLYHAGKVQFLLVSGDNHRNGYDEPTDMKEALIKKGVPADRIYCDYAGFRTFDSVIRAHSIFGQEDCTIVSQRFHNERALFIARRSGMNEAVAFNADDINSESMAKMYLREIPARIMAVLDVEFLGTKPKFLGHPVSIGLKTPPVDAQPAANATESK